MGLLFRVHSLLLQQPSQPPSTTTTSLDETFSRRARRYMRYATTIANHIQVPVQDLVWVEVDYDYENNNHNDSHDDETSDTTTTTATTATSTTTTKNNKKKSGNDHPHLRHLVAVDHAHQEVVLAIRGTFSVQEIVVDLTSFSREGFGGGEAHEGMATMAERLWQVAGPAIVKTLKDHPNYNLVVTGHSLGAGTASLLTILLKQQQQQQQQQFHLSRGKAPEDTTAPMILPSTSSFRLCLSSSVYSTRSHSTRNSVDY